VPKIVPQSLAKVLVHIVYSTKGRRPWLRDEEFRRQLYSYKAAILRNNVDTPALVIGGVEDHIHALCLLSRKFAVKDVIEEAKTETTKWIKKHGPQYLDFHWQSGYAIFSVSESNLEQVKRYIAHQANHHRKMSFQEEFRKLCERHGVEIDERYVWD
jgi:putative transposase